MKYFYNYIEEIAQELLKRYNCYKAGFNVYNFANKLKITVLNKDMSDDVSGLFVRKGNESIISVNKNETKQRKRFTVAHELGHFFLHSDEKPVFVDKSPKVLYRNSASSTGELHQEREANAFAAALLMPRGLLKREILNANKTTPNPIKLLSDKFEVSEQAMSFRLANLGYDAGLYH